MEANRMKPTLTLLAALMVTGSAGAGEVYVTRDAQGNPVYTDTPQSIPAQKLDIRSSSTDPAEVQARYEEQMQRQSADAAAKAKSAAATTDAGRARELTAEDRAKRCVEARQRYEAVMGSYRVYEEGPDGERRYLSSAEIDTARADARQLMDQFCSDQ
jgi:Domain of unknown function (DUF4124)